MCQSPHGSFSYIREEDLPTGASSPRQQAGGSVGWLNGSAWLRSNAVQRVASGVVLVPLVTVFLWRSPAFATTTVCSFAASVCSYEYACMANRIQHRILRRLESLENEACGTGQGGGDAVPEQRDTTEEELELERTAVAGLAKRYFRGREWQAAVYCSGILTLVSSTVFLLGVQWVPMLDATEFYQSRRQFAAITGFVVGFCACKTPDWQYAVVVLIQYLIFVLLTTYSAICTDPGGTCKTVLSRRRALLGGTAVILMFRFASSRNGTKAFVVFMLDVLGLVYVVGLLSVIVAFMNDNRRSDYRKLLIALLYVVWASDSGAYLVGKTLAYFKYPYYHPLAAHLSKNKDYEGTLGAIAFGIVAMVVASDVLNLPGSFGTKVAYTVIAVIAGRLGDLFESLLKRAAGVKDSGKFIPGHGGALDRIDALMFATLVFSRYYASHH